MYLEHLLRQVYLNTFNEIPVLKDNTKAKDWMEDNSASRIVGPHNLSFLDENIFLVTVQMSQVHCQIFALLVNH